MVCYETCAFAVKRVGSHDRPAFRWMGGFGFWLTVSDHRCGPRSDELQNHRGKGESQKKTFWVIGDFPEKRPTFVN